MEISGLLRRYPVGRFLSNREESSRLKQKERLDILPASWLATVRLNSTYLELVGKFYDGKGFLSLGMLAMILGYSGGLYLLFCNAITRPAGYDGKMNDVFIVITMIALYSPLIWFSSKWLLLLCQITFSPFCVVV